MAKFKEWIMNEDGFAGAGGNSWDVIYPTYADDYPQVSATPRSHFFLQFRWDRGLELGRSLINIDNEEFQKRGYVGIESSDIPNSGESGWKHKYDDGGTGSQKPYNMKDLVWLADGKTSEQTKALDRGATYRSWTSHGGSSGYEPDVDLCKIFGDKCSHKWPTIDVKHMDSPFRKKYEESLRREFAMHGGIYDTPIGNSNMPVRSKHQAKDGRNVDDEPFDVEPSKLFGFRKWMSKMGKKRLPNRIHKSRSAQTGVPIQNDRPMM